MLTMLTKETAVAVNALLRGCPASGIVPPNGTTPPHEVALVEQLMACKPATRNAELARLLESVPDSGAIYAQIFQADAPAVVATIKERTPKPEKDFTSEDYIALLSRLGYTFRVCDLDDRVEVNGAVLTDLSEAEMRARLRNAGCERVNVARDAMLYSAARNRYHPIRRWLDTLHWDGQDHISHVASYFADTEGIFPALLRLWLVGAVRKAYARGQNRMLVLDGAQGIGKSTFTRWLGKHIPTYTFEGPINPDNKDYQELLISKLIWEVAELESTTRRADVNALKFFITQEQVTMRVPYARNAITKPALASFIGTINNISGFLNDKSGSRRFMTANLTDINFAYSKLDPANLWAQAMALMAQGVTAEPSPELLTRINAINAGYEVEDPIEDLITKLYTIDLTTMGEFTPTLEIIESLHEQGWRANNPSIEAMMIASAANRLKLKRGRHGTLRGYYGLIRK